MHIAFCSSEVFPFAKTGGMADVCGSLPIALEKLGIEVSIFTPKYKGVEKANLPLEKINDSLFKSKVGENITVYLIANDHFYYRDGIYGDGHGDFRDNLDRFTFFCNKILDTIKEFSLKVDILHCHDWQTALLPVYIKEKYGFDEAISKIKTILTLHNVAYQGTFNKLEYHKIGLGWHLFSPRCLEFYGSVNLLKAGIIYSDEITTVSSRYAREIKTRDFGYRMEGVLNQKRVEIIGILNGIDYSVWSPDIDEYLPVQYSKEGYKEGKQANKRLLQQRVSLPQREDVPIYGFVGRLSHQKGLDLILSSLDELLRADIQFVFQGVGEGRYYNWLFDKQRYYRDKVSVSIEFGEHLAHQIYAGSDFFLMPSIYEPCGLSQMISLRYGSIPIVFNTGGLADTIIPENDSPGKVNGFIFYNYNRNDFISSIWKSLGLYRDKVRFDDIVANALNCDFSWDNSAGKYKEVYKCLLSA
ncbi:MAG: glycogen synthase [Candidatus Omnitrophica bacterium]|nr:glycogen synthase [Candidatus Omnitrophota bacterium]